MGHVREVPHATAAAMVAVAGEYFMKPLKLPPSPAVPFARREKKVVWRGMASGHLSEHNLRYRIVKRLSGYPGADVAFSALVDGQKAFFGKRLQQGLELLKPISMPHSVMATKRFYLFRAMDTNKPVAALSSGCVPVICLHGNA